MPRPCYIGHHPPKKAVTSSFLVPVCVVVEDDVVAKAVILDETDVTNPQYVDGDEDYVNKALNASLNEQVGPADQIRRFRDGLPGLEQAPDDGPIWHDAKVKVSNAGFVCVEASRNYGGTSRAEQMATSSPL